MGENVVFLVVFDTCDVMYNWSISLLPPWLFLITYRISTSHKNYFWTREINGTVGPKNYGIGRRLILITYINHHSNAHVTQQLCSVGRRSSLHMLIFKLLLWDDIKDTNYCVNVIFLFHSLMGHIVGKWFIWF